MMSMVFGNFLGRVLDATLVALYSYLFMT